MTAGDYGLLQQIFRPICKTWELSYNSLIIRCQTKAALRLADSTTGPTRLIGWILRRWQMTRGQMIKRWVRPHVTRTKLGEFGCSLLSDLWYVLSELNDAALTPITLDIEFSWMFSTFNTCSAQLGWKIRNKEQLSWFNPVLITLKVVHVFF